MYGRLYSVSFSNVTLSAAQDLFELQPADDKPIIVHKVVVAPDTSETNQQVKVTVKRFSGAFTSGSVGSTATPVALDSHDAAAGFACEINNTTRCTGGTSVVIVADSFPSQGGWEYMPDVRQRPKAYQAEAIVIGVEEATSAAYSGYAIVEEI